MTQRACRRCSVTQDLSEFRLKQNWHEHVCYTCSTEAARRYNALRYAQPTLRKLQLDQQRQKKTALKEKIIAYLGGKCHHCGVIDCYAIYDVHHCNPMMKDIKIAMSMHKQWEVIKTELDKDVLLLCSNCHRKEHVRLRNLTTE